MIAEGSYINLLQIIMTICLAAIGKEGSDEFIVFATDHMVSTALGQFEHSIVKYQRLNKNTVAMLAGNPLIFNDLIKLSKQKLPYDKIKKEVFDNFKKKREEQIKNVVFDIFGIDKEYFLDILRMPQLNPALQKIIKDTAETSLETGILLIGFQNGDAQITAIDQAEIYDLRSINFHAIGSGNVQAMNSLLFQRQSKKDGTKKTLYNVYKAKRNAEVLVGVGKETDLLILKKDSCAKINDVTMNTLNEVYEEEQKYGKSHRKLIDLDLSKVCEEDNICIFQD